MKRLLITLTLSLLAVATVVLWRGWPRLFPSSEVSNLYRRYEHNDHIRATEIHDFQVNDTLAVETVLLQATTDSAWCALMVDFGAPAEFMELYMTDKSLFIGDDINAITLIYVDKDDVRKHLPQADPNSRLVLVSHAKKTICVFIIEDKNTKEQIYSEETQKLKL